MAQKRKHFETEAGPESIEVTKKAKKGFTVGPDNLPDGTYRRKAKKIKDDLIHKAKTKKSYAKLKEREKPDEGPSYNPYAAETSSAEPSTAPTLDLHPERQAMLDNPASPSPPRDASRQSNSHSRPRKPARPRLQPFAKESRLAKEKQEMAEARQRSIEESRVQREKAIADRERLRKMTMAARKPDRKGRRKLGRESKVLLERVKRLVGE